MNIFLINKLEINANIAPTPNQNTKNPTVKDSITKHKPAIISKNCHIINSSKLKITIHLYYNILCQKKQIGKNKKITCKYLKKMIIYYRNKEA